MNPTLHAIRAGLDRGWREFRQSMTTAADLTYALVINGILLTVLYFQRNSQLEGAWHSLAAATMPSLLGMTVAVGGLMTMATVLTMEREDGTLLRAKATPRGLVGYLVAKIVLISLNTLVSVVVLMVGGVLLTDGPKLNGLAGLLTLAWVLALGLTATLPWGAIIGASLKSSSSVFSLTFLPIGGLAAISGIFYPIAVLPGWLQGVAQVFPMYWLGLGMRSALLPDAAATAEIGQSWRHLETATVLGIWAVVGLIFAPRVLRRMARRESTSFVQLRRQQVLQRGY